MMWLESHGNLARHPKTRRLMRLMGWSLPSTIGNLHLLWYWALDFAPTGDLTPFEPEQLTYDLDLNGATPEQFIDALVEAGFLDRGESETLRLHDWPEYTAKSLRPKFRRNPERWHQLLRSYGLPVITRRTSRRDPAVQGQTFQDARRIISTAVSPTNDDENEPHVSIHSGHATPAVSESPASQLSAPSSTAQNVDETGARLASTHPGPIGGAATIPAVLASQPHFGAWWSKLLELYKNKGCPMTAYEQSEVLAMLARQPLSAVSMLKQSVRNFETSFAALPALGGKRPANTS